MKSKTIFITIAIFLFLISSVYAQNNVKLYLFYGDGCPHCAAEEKFLETLKEKYPTLEVAQYETWYNKENADLFVKLSEACGTKAMGVPTTFIGEDFIIGFDNEQGKGKDIENKIVKCIETGCIDSMDKLKWGSNCNCTNCTCDCTIPEEEKTVNVPFFGEIDIKNVSVPALAVILGAADGFNACAMFVLLILIGILIRTQSRKRMALIAGIFLITSGTIYLLFMTVWLNAFILMGRLGILFTLVGVIAIIVGLINVKDFFFFGKGPSLQISEKSKTGIFEKVRKIVNAESLYIMLVTVIILAVSVNFVEFLCTFGFPMVFTSVLASSSLPKIAQYGYLLLYILFYMIDDLIVVIIAIITLSSKKLTEGYGKILKLVAGLLMLVLGLILLIKPSLLMLG